MLHLFRRPTHKPRDTREMIRVLRAAAQFSDDAAQRLEYEQAADALDRVLTAAARHSDAPTRDAFAYALGRAELDLGDKLTELIEDSKEDHMLIQQTHGAVAEQGAAAGALWAAFQSLGESLTAWREEIETWRGLVDATLASFRESRDESKDERKQIQERIGELDMRHGEQWQQAMAQWKQAMDAIAEIQRLLEMAGANGTHDGGGNG
jgi:hypothetical protein